MPFVGTDPYHHLSSWLLYWSSTGHFWNPDAPNTRQISWTRTIKVSEGCRYYLYCLRALFLKLQVVEGPYLGGSWRYSKTQATGWPTKCLEIFLQQELPEEHAHTRPTGQTGCMQGLANLVKGWGSDALRRLISASSAGNVLNLLATKMCHLVTGIISTISQVHTAFGRQLDLPPEREALLATPLLFSLLVCKVSASEGVMVLENRPNPLQ